MAGIKPEVAWSPANEAAAIVTNDNANIPNIPPNGCKVFVGVTGDVTVDFALGGTNVTLKGCVAGSVLPILVKRVYTTGTSATNLVALW